MTKEINYGDCWEYPIPKINSLLATFRQKAEELENKVDNATSVKTGTITPYDGYTITDAEVKQQGNLVSVSGYITSDNNFPSVETTFAEISGVDLPLTVKRMLTGAGTAGYTANNPCYLSLGRSGILSVRNPVPTNKVVVFNFTYSI